jgi:phospholipid/cholesterol/gamma-HCH transport system substrate-binding protein
MKTDWRERELTMEVIVGAFMVMIFLGMGYFTIILSKETWFTQKTEMRITFNNVMGLRSGDSVVVRGMPIGKVKGLELFSACQGVCVTVVLDKPLELYEDYAVTIVTTSILGGRQMEIHEGSPERLVVKKDVYDGVTPYDLMADASQIVNAVRKGLIEGGVVDNIRESSKQINEMIARVHAGQGPLGRLLSEDARLYDDLAASAVALRTMLERVERGESAVGKFLSTDDKVYRDLADTVNSLKAVAKGLAEGQGTLGKLLAADDGMYRDLSAAIAALKVVAERIESGQGMVGKLVMDETLYDEIRGIISEVRAAVDDLREASPVTTFSSVFFGAF